MKTLYRSKKDKFLGGVCGGMGKYFNIDSNIVRLIWVLVGCSGLGLVLYLVAYCIVPEEPDIIDTEAKVVYEEV